MIVLIIDIQSSGLTLYYCLVFIQYKMLRLLKILSIFLILNLSYCEQRLYIYSHPCAENFPLSVTIEQKHGNADLTNFKLQLFLTKEVNFCDINLSEKSFETQKSDMLPALIYNSHKCYKQLINSTLPGVKILILAKFDWKTYNNQQAKVLSQLKNLLILIVSQDDIFNIQKYAEKCDSLHAEVYVDSIKYPTLMENIDLPNLYFNIEYKNGFNYFRQFYLHHLFEGFYQKLNFTHLILYTNEECKDCNPQKDCYVLKGKQVKKICYEPYSQSLRSGKQILRNQMRSFVIFEQSQKLFWWKYMILFADNTCDEAVDLDNCVFKTLLQLGLQKEQILSIQKKTDQYLQPSTFERFQTVHPLTKFTKTQSFKQNIYKSRVYSSLLKICKETAVQLNRQPFCGQLQNRKITLSLTSQKNPVIKQFITPNFNKGDIVTQTIELNISKLNCSELMIILKSVDKSYTEYFPQGEIIRPFGNFYVKQTLKPFQLSYIQRSHTEKDYSKTQYDYKTNSYGPSDKRSKINTTSEVNQNDRSQQIAFISFSPNSTKSNLQVKLAFNGHQKYILQFYYKNKTHRLKDGDSFVHRILSQYNEYQLIFEDIQNKFFNFYYVECNIKNISTYKMNLTLRSKSYKTIQLPQQSYKTSSLTIPKKYLINLWKQGEINCTTKDVNTTCFGTLRLQLKSNNSSSSFNRKIVKIRYYKYQSNKLVPFNYQVQTLRLQNTLVQYFDMNSYGESDKILPYQIKLKINEVSRQIRICSKLSQCDFYTKQNWKDMIEGQTKILPYISTSNVNSYSNDAEIVLGFKHPATKFRRDQKVRSVRIFLIYNLLQPQYMDFTVLKQQVGSRLEFYFQNDEESSGVEMNYNYPYVTSHRFMINHRDGSKNIVYYAYLSVNNQDGIRVYAKANLNNNSQQLHFQTYKKHQNQGLRRVFEPNFFEFKVKIFSSEVNKVFIDVYVQDRFKQMNRNLSIYNIGFTSYKSIDPIRLMPINRAIKINTYSQLYSKNSKPHYLVSFRQFMYLSNCTLLITIETVQTVDLSKIFLCYLKQANSRSNKQGEQICMKDNQFWVTKNQQDIGFGYKINTMSYSQNVLFNIYHEKGQAIQIKIAYYVYNSALDIVQNKMRAKELKNLKYYSQNTQARVKELSNNKDSKQYKIMQEKIWKQQTKNKQEKDTEKSIDKNLDFSQVQRLQKQLLLRTQKLQEESKKIKIMQQKNAEVKANIQKQRLDLQKDMKYVQQKGTEYRDKKKQLQNQDLQLKKQEQALKIKKESINKVQQDLKKQKQMYQKEKQDSNKQLLELSIKQTKVKQEKISLQRLQEENKKMKTRVNQQKATIQQEEKSNKIRLNKIADLKNKIEKAQTQNNILAEKIQKKTKQIQQQQQKIAKLKAEKSKLQAQIVDMQQIKKENKILKQKIQKMQVDATKEMTKNAKIIKEQKDKIQQLTKQIDQKEKMLKATKTLYVQLEKRLEQKEQIMNQAKYNSSQSQIKRQDTKYKITLEVEVEKNTIQKNKENQPKKEKSTQKQNQQKDKKINRLDIKDGNLKQPTPKQQKNRQANKDQIKQGKNIEETQEYISFLQIILILLIILLLVLCVIVFFLRKMIRNLSFKNLKVQNVEQSSNRIKEVIKKEKDDEI